MNIVFLSDTNYINAEDFFHITTVSSLEGMKNIDALICDSEKKFSIEDFYSIVENQEIPVLYITKGVVTDEEIGGLLEEGYADIIIYPQPFLLIMHRIEQAIIRKNSYTHEEIGSILHELPANIYLKDVAGRYVFCSHYWNHLIGKDKPGWTIKGKTDIEIRKDKENAKKAMETDKNILETDRSVKYIVKEEDDDVIDYLEITKCPIHHDGKVAGIIALINNVTENQVLKDKLEKLTKTDQLTGLNNKITTENMIREWIDSERSEHAALFMIDLDDFKNINDSFGHSTGDKVLMTIGDTLSQYFGKNIIGRVGGDEFMMFADVDDMEDVYHLADRIVTKTRMALDRIGLAGETSVSVGTAMYPQQGTSFKLLYDAADKALYRAKKFGKNRFIAS